MNIKLFYQFNCKYLENGIYFDKIDYFTTKTFNIWLNYFKEKRKSVFNRTNRLKTDKSIISMKIIENLFQKYVFNNLRPNSRKFAKLIWMFSTKLMEIFNRLDENFYKLLFYVKIFLNQMEICNKLLFHVKKKRCDYFQHFFPTIFLFFSFLLIL